MWSRKQARRINKGNDVDLLKLSSLTTDTHTPGVSVFICQYNSALQAITDTSAQIPFLSLFLHLDAQGLDGADNLFGGGGACHGDEAAGEVDIYILGAG